MTLAAYEAYHITDAMLPKVINTFRLFIDSMDFLDEMGNGWDIFDSLCDSSNAANGDRDAKISLLLWMLRLLSFELKTYFVRQRFLRMLNWTIHPDPRLEEASTLLLNLGGAEIIDAPFFGTDGYTILHRNVAYATDGEVSATLARGPDLYRLGIDYDYTPQYESPTSLAMYSSWAFADWLRELIAIEVDTEELIGQELERNPWVHPGWEKETLRDLFAYRYRPDLDFRDCWTCSDCTGRSISFVKVQPYWRHLLERIKQRIDPDRPEQAASEVDETENADVRNIAEPTSSSNNLAHGTYTTETLLLDALNELSSESELEQEPGLASEPESEKESEEDEDVHGYPETISIRSECIYDWNEVVCVDCWLRYRRTGTRPPPGARKRRFALYFDDDSPLDEYSPAGDESSEDEYSPYLIHS